MTSPERSWRISKIANVARRAIESLDLDLQGRILAELENLQANPFSRDIPSTILPAARAEAGCSRPQLNYFPFCAALRTAVPVDESPPITMSIAYRRPGGDINRLRRFFA